MENNDFLKAVCRNRDDLIEQMIYLGDNEKFVVIKEGGKPVILIGTNTRKHGRIVLEYLDQKKKKSVIVSGGGSCGRDGDSFRFHSESTNFKSAKNTDIEAVFSLGKTPLKISYECYGDAEDKTYSFDEIRRFAL